MVRMQGVRNLAPVSMSPCRAMIVAVALVLCSGCATIQTLDVAYRRAGNGPLIVSGTCFDAEAIFDPQRAERRFGVDGPSLPWADLPFSLLLDMIVLPSALLIELMESS